MHELAITESLLELTLKHAADSGALRVTDLYLVVGGLSSVVDDSVQFYWDIVSQGSPAEGAQLHFRRLPVELRCLDCEVDYRPVHDELACPRCDGVRVQVLQGDEFHLEAIDVATEEELAAAPATEVTGAMEDEVSAAPTTELTGDVGNREGTDQDDDAAGGSFSTKPGGVM